MIRNSQTGAEDLDSSSKPGTGEIEVMIDEEIVCLFQSEGPDWRERMEAVLAAAVKQI